MRQLLCFELGGAIYSVLFSHILIEMFAGPDEIPSSYSCNLSCAGHSLLAELDLYFDILTISMVQVKVLLDTTSSRKQQWRC